MGSHGHHVDFDAAHYQPTSFNELARLGTVGTVFHACCLLETTTNAFHIRMLPSAPHTRRCASSVPITRLVPAWGRDRWLWILGRAFSCAPRFGASGPTLPASLKTTLAPWVAGDLT